MSAADVQNMQVQAEVATKKVKLSLKKNVSPQSFNGPAKPPSGFFLYGNKHRPAITESIRNGLKDGEKFNVAMVASAIGAKWKGESEEVKASFNKEAAVAKAKYDTDLEKWKLSNDYKLFLKASALHQKKKADKKALVQAKADGMPQRPMAGYMIFGNEIRDTVRKELEAKGEKFTVMAGAAATKAKWVALGEAGQQKYQDAYKVAKAKFDEDMKKWEESDAGKTFAKAKSVAAKRKQKNSKAPKAKRAKKDDAADDDEDDEEDIEISESEGEEEAEE